MTFNDPRDRNHHTIKWQGLTFPGSIKLLAEAVLQGLAKSLGQMTHKGPRDFASPCSTASANSFMDPGKVTPCHFIVWWFLAKTRRLTLMLKFA